MTIQGLKSIDRVDVIAPARIFDLRICLLMLRVQNEYYVVFSADVAPLVLLILGLGWKMIGHSIESLW